jgi:peptide/nickel transport system substrate-binding protein
MTDQQLIDVFGSGYWKTDKAKAASLLEGAGFTLQGGRWNKPDGTPWVISVLVHPEDFSSHVHRAALALADQWEKFGITTDITILHGGDIGTRTNLGEFETVSNWPWCSSYRMDFYNNISGWNFDVFNFDLGEVATGISAYRLPKADPILAGKIAAVIQRLEQLDPNGPEIQSTIIEFLKLTTEAHSGIQVHSGIKLVPVNETYWTGYPTSENPYEGPWWWWSLFRGIVTSIKPVK